MVDDLCGWSIFTLGVINFYKLKRFNLISIVLIILSVVITIRSHFANYILYIPVIIIFISPFIFRKEGLKSLVYFYFIIGIGILIELDTLSNYLQSLSDSSSNILNTKPGNYYIEWNILLSH